ncbi:MAG: hypothetical protein PHG49_04055 [Candidatus Pacebacteria bacterium]|nr:hypothetical protein [Candidatus Paceibacterota bacterium]
MDIFLSVVKNLNQINIIPIVYGSLGLSLIIGEKYTINDIDLIIFDEDFNKK